MFSGAWKTWKNQGIFVCSGNVSTLLLFFAPFCLYVCQVISLVLRKLLEKMYKNSGNFEKLNLEKLKKSGNFCERNYESRDILLEIIPFLSSLSFQIRPFKKAHMNRSTDQELLMLSKYLKRIAFIDDFTTLIHQDWER